MGNLPTQNSILTFFLHLIYLFDIHSIKIQEKFIVKAEILFVFLFDVVFRTCGDNSNPIAKI